MKIQVLCVALLTLMTSLRAQNTIIMDSLSYSVGVLVGKNLQQQGLESLDVQSFSSALSDIFEGQDLKISPDQAGALFQSHMQKQQEKMFAGVKEAGDSFLATNKQRAEVQTTSSGLQYEVLQQGTGDSPSASSQVTVHYEGTLIDGTVFDSSIKRGEPATFPVNGVIQGWQEVLPMMKVGDKWKVYIPYDLAYGERGAGQDIKPYSTLIFEMELLGIK